MDKNEIRDRINALEEDIYALPKGSVSTKTVNGHTYYYHRWYENPFRTNVRSGHVLREFAEPVRRYKKRTCFQALAEYVYGL